LDWYDSVAWTGTQLRERNYLSLFKPELELDFRVPVKHLPNPWIVKKTGSDMCKSGHALMEYIP